MTPSRLFRTLITAVGVVACAGAGPTWAQESAAQAWTAEVEQLATQAARAALGGRPDVRVEVAVGALDPRLKLAPCGRVHVYLPVGQRAWGRTRIGVQCSQGSVAWNVYLPLVVKLHAPAAVVTQALAAGTVLQAEHLRMAETDWAAAESPVFSAAHLAVGRTLAHGLAVGAAVRDADLKKRQWFAAGDPVRILAKGPGFMVSGEGVAMTPGLEGQPVRVRTESGRTVQGMATGERRVELAL